MFTIMWEQARPVYAHVHWPIRADPVLALGVGEADGRKNEGRKEAF